jgi:hypothetical protein
MKKILFFFFLFILFTNQLFASQNKSQINFNGCNNSISVNNFNKINKLKIKKIEVDVHKYKKWTVNNIKIITSGTRFISNELKKKFEGDIIVLFEDGTKCIFKGRIRHSGDAKDHIALKGNSVIQSLDIHLENGNIRGITKFKLFKPDVRGNLEDVIIQNQLLRNFGYLAPRSIKVDVRVNQTESIMLFQEKAAKELLEFNNRREGPILEGDQRFFFKLVEIIPDNNLSNWDVGTPFLRNKSSKVMLSKVTNSRLIDKSDNHKKMVLNSVNNLNLIYLYWSNRFQDEKNNFFFFDYDLDNTLLGLFEKSNIKKLDTYNIFMQSTNSQHGLSVSNRKFYWNSIENYFEPITYDANPGIEQDFSTTTTALYRFPVSKYFNDSFDNLEKKLKDINFLKFYNQIELSGLDLTKKELKKKINRILVNLQQLKKNYLKTDKKELIEHNNYQPIKNITDQFNKVLNEIDPNAYLISYNTKNNKLERCKIYLKKCELFELSNENLSGLLEGELKIDNFNYQYLGKNLNFNTLIKNKDYKKKVFNQSTIFYKDGIEINLDENNNTITINQTVAGSRAFIMGGKLKKSSIIFNGIKSNNIEIKKSMSNYPIDIRGLTGCFSLINIELEDVNIKAKNSNCEDAINFINAKGSINKINIENSFSDALDVDFSDLKFNDVNIFLALNDCTDFSGGNYNLINLKLSQCGDKGLSIGENSNVKLDKIYVDIANIGIATKDSSILKLNKAVLKNIQTCISAYNKKQEFQGGLIKINYLNCENYFKYADIDNLSKIVLKEEPLFNTK